MPYQRPTLTALIAQAKSDIASHLPGSDPLLRRCVEEALARSAAGLAHGLHGHAMWLSKQLLPDVADYEWLVRWCSIRGITPTLAIKAHLHVDITGTGTAWCPTGAGDAMPTWVANDGTLYVQDARVQLAAGAATIGVTADVAGVAGNQVNGVLLSLTSAVTSIDSTGTVSATGTIGFDQESAASLLARYLLNLQSPPKGGGPGDYETWMLTQAGVTRAWEFPRANGVGTVVGRFVCDGLTPIIPTGGIVATVQAAMDLIVPVTVDFTAVAPTGTDLDFAIQLSPGGVGADTVAIRAAVEANLADIIFQKQMPDGFTLYLVWLEEAVATATGVTNYLMTAPAANIVYPVGEMPLMGTVTFT